MANFILNHQLQCESHDTYTVCFFGDTISTTVTADPTIVSNWISKTISIHHHILRSLIVGLDVEWRPNYTRGGVQNPVATVQICVDRRCLIYQIIHSNYIPQSLHDFLSNNYFTFVGVGVQSDLDKLVAQYGIGRNARAVDLPTLAADAYELVDLKQVSMKFLANLVLGKEMEKPKWVSISRWDNRFLTDAQVQYACIDAFVSFEIGRILDASNYYNYCPQINFGNLLYPN